MVNAEKWGAKINKWGRCQLAIAWRLCVSALSSQLSVFSKLCIKNILLHFLLLLCQSCRSLRNVSLGGRILGLIKSAYHGWPSMMTSSEGPLFSLASGPPNPKPTTAYTMPGRIAGTDILLCIHCQLFLLLTRYFSLREHLFELFTDSLLVIF